MHRSFSLLALLLIAACATPERNDTDVRQIDAFFDEALQKAEAYENLRTLSYEIGPRLSGSPQAEASVQWTKQVMEDYGFDRVYLQEVMVPHWERGPAEVVRIVGQAQPLRALALGGSEPTPAAGITAEVVMVDGLDAVDELGEAVRGKIVFYNRPFDQTVLQTGRGYGTAVDQRTQGPAKAGEYGAAAVVIRSVTSSMDDAPHTGTTRYAEGGPRIPAAALGVQSANRLVEALEADPTTQLYLKINSQWHEDKLSHNVIGELRGSEHPDQVIVVGCHLDSWDVGHGAHDDGAGCVQSMGVLRLFQQQGYQPRHTIRAVLFMNEENGLRGGLKYAEEAGTSDETHVIAFESDAGGFSPRGFGVTASDAIIQQMRDWLPYFSPHTIAYIGKGGGGADINPLNRQHGVPVVGLSTESQRVFDVHHSENDVFENVNRRELELGTASMASMIYLIDKYGLPE